MVLTISIEPKKIKPTITPLTVEQLLKFKDTIVKDPVYAGFLLQATTAIRRGECLGLTWENVHLDDGNGYISINQQLVATSSRAIIDTPKTPSSIRDVPLTEEVIEVLRAHSGDKTNGLVITTKNGTPISPRNYQRSFDRLLGEAGLIKSGVKKCRIHDLRHGVATMLCGAGVDMTTTAQLLGHTTTRMVADTYNHPTMLMKEAAMKNISDILNTPQKESE